MSGITICKIWREKIVWLIICKVDIFAKKLSRRTIRRKKTLSTTLICKICKI